MSVALILSVKGRDVITTEPHRTLAEAARLLAEKGIGAVVVCDVQGHLEGIISERDIVRAIAEQGAAALEHRVSDHMTGKVATATPDTTTDQLMEQMTAGRFRHVPVLQDGRLAGLVSIGDVVKFRVEMIESEHRALKEYIATA